MMPNPLVPPTLPSWPRVKDAMKKGMARTQVPPRPETFRDVENDNDPDAVDPIAESRPGYLPYRGTEFHGVPPKSQWIPDAEGYGDGSVPVVYDDDSGPDHVVNVRVITDSKEEVKAFRVGSSAVGADARQVVSRQRNRTNLKIRNMHATDRVWLGHNESVSANNGYPLDANAEITVTSTEAVWMVSATVNVVPIAMWSDYTQDI